jgi:hypothetical protein
MEVYRHLKVDLVVSHVISIVQPIFELMKIYEKEGLLAILPGVRFPFEPDEMKYDGNSETEFNGIYKKQSVGCCTN